MSREIDDLYWEAFRYAAEEMSVDEASQFEKRLETEQPSREAVARVFELSQIVRALPVEAFDESTMIRTPAIRTPAMPVVPVTQNRNWMQPVGWMAVGVAACLAVMMGLQSVAPRLSPSSAVMVAGKSGTTNDALARAWLRTHDAVFASAVEAEGLTSDMTAFSVDEEEFDMDSSSPHADAPTWMMAAVSATPESSEPVEN